MPDRMDGGCACGRIRYSARIETEEAYLCHCRMCERATGSVSIAFKNLLFPSFWIASSLRSSQ